MRSMLALRQHSLRLLVSGFVGALLLTAFATAAGRRARAGCRAR